MLSRFRTAQKVSARFLHEAASLKPSDSRAASFEKGQRVHGFIVENSGAVPELQLKAIQLSHEKTGAQLFHVIREDSNNVFGVAFRTAPMDSTGVPHILEHTALCGSQKYPVRDPFFKMLNRSMATYMNAWTASDFTMYPFSTENSQDLENLRSVYLDATFRPLLQQTDFLQEGWRLEHENIQDPKSPIQFKGVVYNEMKGAFSDAGSLFCTRLQQHLFPTTTYSFVSGGDPPFITDLSHKMLVDFHRQNYHPSNARFYTYGDYPLEKHLEAVNGVLSQFEKTTTPKAVLIPPAFAPKKVFAYGPPDPMGDMAKQTKMCVSFVLNDVQNTYETFALRILSYLLIDGQASPFYKALIESNIGSDYAAGTGYDTSTKIASFSVGLQGLFQDDVDKVESIIHNVFEQSAKTGFDMQRVEAAIHQIELGTKHKTANFGMNLSHGLMSGWYHGADPFDLLDINKKIAWLRSKTAKGRFFEELIDRYFIKNGNRLTFVMHPDENYHQSLQAEENTRLKRVVSGLTKDDLQQIYENGQSLEKLQNSKQDLSSLPCLDVNDITRIAKSKPIEKGLVGIYPIQWRKTGTNGITYFKSLVSWSSLPQDLRPYLPLFTSALTSLGTTKTNPGDFDEKIRLHTGGIGASNMVSTFFADLNKVQEGLIVSGNCLDRNVHYMYDLLEEALNEANFDDEERLRTLILGSASGLMNSVSQSGHGFASKMAASGLTATKHISEIYGGLTQVTFMNNLANQENLGSIISKLKEISAFLQQSAQVRSALTVSDETAAKANEQELARFFPKTKWSPESDKEYTSFNGIRFDRQTGQKIWVPLPFATNFSARCIRTEPYECDRVMSYRVLSSLMTHQYLHREIREKNGAYGGGASYNAMDGIFGFYSYRDPNPVLSCGVFTRALEWASKEPFTDQQLKESKLSILSSMDAPVNVSNEGMTYFQHRITTGLRQKHRDALFNLSARDVQHAAEHLLSLLSQSNQVVLAGEGIALPLDRKEWTLRPLEEITV